MPDAQKNMVQMVKQAAMEAVRAGKPAELRFGTVVSVSPLEIRIDQKSPLRGPQLILTRNVNTPYYGGNKRRRALRGVFLAFPQIQRQEENHCA